MSSLHVYLQAELSTLSNEARRKFPEIKEACEKVIMIMRITKDRSATDIAQDLAKTEETLKPIYLSCNTKLPKLISIAISCLQKLILHKAVPEKSIGSILRVLSDVLACNVEVQLRVLQTVLPLLTNYNNIQGELLNSALLICFRLQESKVSVVNNTAAATLRQLLIITFDKKIKFSKEDHINYDKDILDTSIEHDVQVLVSSLSPDAKDAYFLFQDLCHMTNGEPPLLLKLTTLNRTFGLELIESVLTNQTKVFQVYPEFTALLRQKLCPLIIRAFSEKGDFAQTTRVMRLVFLLIRLFNHILIMESEIFLSMLLKVLEAENLLWQRILALEVIKGICNDDELLKTIYKKYDNENSNVFKDIVGALSKLVNENPLLFRKLSNNNLLELNQNDNNIFSLDNSAMRIQCIDLLDKSEAPNIPSGYMLFIALNSIESIINGLCKNNIPNFNKLENNLEIENLEPYKIEEFNDNNNNEDDINKQMVKLSWTGILTVLSFLAKLPMDFSLTQLTVNCLKNFCLLAAKYQLNDARDAFIQCLSQHSYPSINTINDKSNPLEMNYLNNNNIINERHILFLKSLMYIAAKLSEILNTSWILILDTLQIVQHVIHSSNKNRTSPMSPTFQQEAIVFGKNKLDEKQINELILDIKKFFENIKYLNDNAYNDFITSLIQLAVESNNIKCVDLKSLDDKVKLNMEDMIINNSKSYLKMEQNLFSIEQLRSVCLSSMPRLINQQESTLWNLILNNLIYILGYENINFSIRTQICETISDIILTGMNCANSLRLDSTKRVQFQIIIPLAKLMGIKKYSFLNNNPPNLLLQKYALQILDKLLHNNGHAFIHPWNIIFDILLFACPQNLDLNENLEDNDNKNLSNVKLVRIAFPCLQLICTDFLPPLPKECLFNCILTVSKFALQLEDLNTSLTSISMLWNVLDFIFKSLDNINSLNSNDQKDKEYLEFESINFNIDDNNGLILSQLFLLTLSQLCKVGLDSRPEVRNGAIQTLFRTISNNGNSLNTIIWSTLIWKILFPFIDQVNNIYFNAINSNIQQPEYSDMMFHHSRNTSQKQWDESHTLIIMGMTNLLKQYLKQLINIKQFYIVWEKVLYYLKQSVLFDSYEVCTCSIKSLLKLLTKDTFIGLKQDELNQLFMLVWKVWKQLGFEITDTNQINLEIQPLCSPLALKKEDQVIVELQAPIILFKMQKVKQAILTYFIELYSLILDHVKLDSINQNDWKDLLNILFRLISYNSNLEDIINNCKNLSPLQVHFIKIINSFIDQEDTQFNLFLLNQLPQFCLLSTNNENNNNYIKLCCVVLDIIYQLIHKLNGEHQLYNDKDTLFNIYDMLYVLLDKKYALLDEANNDSSLVRWKIAVKLFNKLNQFVLEFIIKHVVEHQNSIIIKILDISQSLFKKNQDYETNLSIQVLEIDEKVEMHTLISLFTHLIPVFNQHVIEQDILIKFVELFYQVSKLDLNLDNQHLPNSILAKENLSFLALKCLLCLCMEPNKRNQLLSEKQERNRKSLGQQIDSDDEDLDDINLDLKTVFELNIPQKLANITTPIFLNRCYSTLYKFSIDVPTFGKRPLPRLQRDEILFLLNLLAQLELIPNTLKVDQFHFIPNINNINAHFLNSNKAHLFLFYPILVNILNCKDAMIVDAIARCLQNIGQALSLV